MGPAASPARHDNVIPGAEAAASRGRCKVGERAPEPWASDMTAALRLIAIADEEIDDGEAALRRLGADHAYVPRLMTAPASAGYSATRPPPRSATSSASLRRRRSWSATPGDAQGWISPVARDWREELAKNGPAPSASSRLCARNDPEPQAEQHQ
jgi:hypothetical protein